jgi:hypothetical protein
MESGCIFTVGFLPDTFFAPIGRTPSRTLSVGCDILPSPQGPHFYLGRGAGEGTLGGPHKVENIDEVRARDLL